MAFNKDMLSKENLDYLESIPEEDRSEVLSMQLKQVGLTEEEFDLGAICLERNIDVLKGKRDKFT